MADHHHPMASVAAPLSAIDLQPQSLKQNDTQLLSADNLFLVAATESTQLNYYYTILELLVALVACVGNALVITVFHRERRLRKRTNYYIVSLAMADFLVGLLGIPFAILASIGLPTNLYGCLLTLSTLVVLCTISIFCLVAVSIDRYWAILYPLAYSRNVRTKTAICEYKCIYLFMWCFDVISMSSH